jgi:hypothetical protein
VGRPVMSDLRQAVPVRQGGGHDRSKENSVPMIGIIFHVSAIAIVPSDRIGRIQP